METEDILDRFLQQAQNLRTNEITALIEKNNAASKIDLKHADEYLDKELQKIKD